VRYVYQSRYGILCACVLDMKVFRLTTLCLVAFCSTGCANPETHCVDGAETSPLLNLSLDRGGVATSNVYTYTGLATVLSRSDTELVLQTADNVNLIASNTSTDGSPSAPIPLVDPGTDLWVDIYRDEPVTMGWDWHITSRINVRQSEGGRILFAEVWDTQTIPQDNAGLGIPIKTNELCSFVTSDPCVSQLRQTEYSLSLQADSPVTLSPGRSASVVLGDNSYRVWLDYALIRTFITQYTCEDGGSGSSFRARLLPENTSN